MHDENWQDRGIFTPVQTRLWMVCLCPGAVEATERRPGPSGFAVRLAMTTVYLPEILGIRPVALKELEAKGYLARISLIGESRGLNPASAAVRGTRRGSPVAGTFCWQSGNVDSHPELWRRYITKKCELIILF